MITAKTKSRLNDGFFVGVVKAMLTISPGALSVQDASGR